MKRQLFIVDGEFRSQVGEALTYESSGARILCVRVTDLIQEAYEFGRQEKAEEILEALAREFFGKEKP